jgi:hypothetical protein
MTPRSLLAVAAFALLCLPLVLLPGCDEDAPAPVELMPTPASRGTHFDAATAGTIRGEVRWEGDLPEVPAFRVRPNPLFGPPLDQAQVRDNPHAPVIDPRTRGVAGAVVFLQGVDPERSRPWDHGPVRVELRGCRIHVLQGDADSSVGFVRRGDPVAFVSKDPFYHTVRAAEAAFFTLTFPDADQPLERRFGKTGQVELSSGVGYYWMRGHLFVDEHSYYARTDTEGRFVLRDVPPGRYQLACWLPSWVEAGHEREPENASIVRFTFRPPVVRTREVRLGLRETVPARFSYATSLFER